jgi:transketolase
MAADIKKLESIAANCRRKVVRMIRSGGSGHLGGALSCLDILTVLFFHTLNHQPSNPKYPDRDRFILSAGHKCMALYSVLCQAGYFEEERLDTYGKLGTALPGHPNMRKLPGIEANTGALGHGLSIAAGMALGLRLDGKASRVFTVLGDGELPEGSNWEAIAAAAHHKIDNLIAFIDDNGLQISGKTTEIMNLEPISDRFKSFGWAVKDIDGNNIKEIAGVLENLPFEKGKPSVIIARTVKAKGLSFAEGKLSYHYWKPSKEELEQAERELDEAIKAKAV